MVFTLDASKLHTVPLFLSDILTLGLKSVKQCGKYEAEGHPHMPRFKAELKMQLYPENASDKSKCKLRRPKKLHIVHEYVKVFAGLMFEILDMLEQDALFMFTDSLTCGLNYSSGDNSMQTLATAICEAKF